MQNEDLKKCWPEGGQCREVGWGYERILYRRVFWLLWMANQDTDRITGMIKLPFRFWLQIKTVKFDRYTVHPGLISKGMNLKDHAD